jgi:hypothetical protein
MDHIHACLESLFAQDYPRFEVIVVDNASTDGLPEYVERSFPQVSVLRSPVNLAYGKGNNLGASLANGQFLLFLNHDTIVTDAFLIELMKVVQTRPEVGVAQSKILMASNPNLIDSAGAYLTKTGMWVHRDHGLPDRIVDTNPIEILGACGACLMVRRGLFETLGGFDPDFVIYFDDADFCWRARLLGKITVLVPSSVIYHWGGATTQRLPSSFTVFHSFKNRLCSLIKLLSLRDLVVVLPIQLGLCFGGALAYFLRLNPANGIAILRAMLWNAANLARTLKKRKVVRRALPDKHRQLYEDLMIPFHLGYFIRTSLRYLSRW